MCTLVALWRAHPAAPLILALNRDELLGRKTAPLSRWGDEPLVAGRDLEAGGTWFGVGRTVVAGLTNHRAALGSPRGHRSRGELVVRALRASSVSALREELRAVPGDEYGGFHLLAGDESDLVVFTNQGGGLAEARAEAGVHVLGNFGLNNATDPVVATVRPAVQLLVHERPDEEALAAGLRDLLARHGEGWPCVHLGPYGTRSSALLFWRAEEPRLEVTEGAACARSWRDESAALRGL
jgi:uncharacterized protein with NRDE domain